MSDFTEYRCQRCPWEKRAFAGGAVSFYFELRHCRACEEIFPYRRPYPGERHPEPSLACPLCSQETREWHSHAREDIVEDRDFFKRLSCPSCNRQTVHGRREAVLHPIYLTSP